MLQRFIRYADNIFFWLTDCDNTRSTNCRSSTYYPAAYKTIILPVVLYGCETWSLILREEHRLRVFENRVLRRRGIKRGIR
jgi:hypothetical protein